MYSGKRKSFIDSNKEVAEKVQRLGCRTYCYDFRYRKFVLHHLMKFMYQLCLSIYFLLQTLRYNDEYLLLSVNFPSRSYELFNIVLYGHGKFIHIIVDNGIKSSEDLSYGKIFGKTNGNNFICKVFSHFVLHQLLNTKKILSDIQYLVVYLNKGLKLTYGNTLKQGNCKNYYPFELNNLNLDECQELRELLGPHTCGNEKKLYQFSRDPATIKNLCEELKVSGSVQSKLLCMGTPYLFVEHMKKKFIKKLVFAVYQPDRKTLNTINQKEIMTNKMKYKSLERRIKRCVPIEKKLEIKNSLRPMLYEFYLFMSLLHTMFVEDQLFSMKFEENIHNHSNYISLSWRDKITYFVTHYSGDGSGNNLFSVDSKTKDLFINKYFMKFVRALEEGKEIKHFVFYTNGSFGLKHLSDLGLGLPILTLQNTVEGDEGKKRQEDKMESNEDSIKCVYVKKVNVVEEDYEELRNVSFLNEDGLYKIAKAEANKSFLCLLNFRQYGEENDRVENKKEIKNRFLNSILFAVKQPKEKELVKFLREGVQNGEKSHDPYSFEELHEVILRWTESDKFGSITKFVVEDILKDIKSDISSKKEGGNVNMNGDKLLHCSEKISFVKTVIGREGVPAFYKLLNAVDCRFHLLKKYGIKLSNISKILSKCRGEGPTPFIEFCDLLLDKEGNATNYLLLPMNAGINFYTISCILDGVGAIGATAYKEWCELMFDNVGRKSNYLVNLEKADISLSSVGYVLSNSNANSPKSFRKLYKVLFDYKGNKSRYLQCLEKEGINLTTIFRIIRRAGVNISRAFKDLYYCFFDKEGNKTWYLEILKNNHINLTDISFFLRELGCNSAKAFKELFYIWFDKDGNITPLHKNFNDLGMTINSVAQIVGEAGISPIQTIKELHEVFFDEKGNKTEYLTTLEKFEISVPLLSSVLKSSGVQARADFLNFFRFWLNGDGSQTVCLQNFEKSGIEVRQVVSMITGGKLSLLPKAITELHDLLFDGEGNMTNYLENLEKLELSFSDISPVLSGSGVYVADAYKHIYHFWFDENGHEKQSLQNLKRVGMKVRDVFRILRGAGSKAGLALEELYSLWFNSKGNKTVWLNNMHKCGISLYDVSRIIGSSGVNAKNSFRELYKLWFDDKGNKTSYLLNLEKAKISIFRMGCIVRGLGFKGPMVFKELCDCWFLETNGKTCQKRLEEEGVTTTAILSITESCPSKAVFIFKEFYNSVFDDEGNKTLILQRFEEDSIKLSDIVCILRKRRVLKTIRKLYDKCYNIEGEKTEYLMELKASLSNSTKDKEIVASEAKTSVKNNSRKCTASKIDVEFQKIISSKFTGNKCIFCQIHIRKYGEMTIAFSNTLLLLKRDREEIVTILNSFFNLGFTGSDMACIFYGKGISVLNAMRCMYSACIDKENKTKRLLLDLLDAGIKPVHLCQMLSGSPETLEEFHKFCCVEKKSYLLRFFEIGFSAKYLSGIFHGAGINICSALKDFYQVCFADDGENTQLLDDFFLNGFNPKYLSYVLTMTGRDAYSTVKKFHKLCFGEKKYLAHFLEGSLIFNSRKLSLFLYGSGVNVCATFEKLHNICFDETGYRTDTFEVLLRENSRRKVLKRLHRKVGGFSPYFCDKC